MHVDAMGCTWLGLAMAPEQNVWHSIATARNGVANKCETPTHIEFIAHNQHVHNQFRVWHSGQTTVWVGRELRVISNSHVTESLLH